MTVSKPLVISDTKIEEFASLGLTDKEITDLAEIDPRDYRAAIAKGRARLHQTLRRAQLKSALKGNASMLIFLGKVYLNQKEIIAHDVSTTREAISITPNVLERLQASYRLTMEQVRTRSDALPAARVDDPGGLPGDRDGVSKTALLSRNSEKTNGQQITQDEF
jgi:hypothetical protein